MNSSTSPKMPRYSWPRTWLRISRSPSVSPVSGAVRASAWGMNLRVKSSGWSGARTSSSAQAARPDDASVSAKLKLWNMVLLLVWRSRPAIGSEDRAAEDGKGDAGAQDCADQSQDDTEQR